MRLLPYLTGTLGAVLCFGSYTPAVAGPNGLETRMLFRSFIQDAHECALDYSSGTPEFAPAVAGSAAITCPDAFAWVSLAKSIDAKWWDWGMDQTVWPANPLALCEAGQTENCCPANPVITASTPQPANCPAFRADYADPSPLPATPASHPSEGVLTHTGLNNVNVRDPDRILRDLDIEMVFRNKPFTQYVLQNNLYNKEGLGAINRAQNKALTAGDIGAAHRLSVSFPTNAVMVKADFVHSDIMAGQGLIEDLGNGGPMNNPDYPYLTVFLTGDPAAGKDNVPGYYYLVAMTNASKDLPNWHWYAVEHVANVGRCDYIGCNDSFGYETAGAMVGTATFGPTYIPPHIVLNDDRISGNDAIFDLGKTYLPSQTGEQMSDALAALFQSMGIGTDATDLDPKTISAGDPAWNNYRLKGTQTEFNTASGVPTGMGASVTEGGFVNSASCLSCHSQASVDENGNAGMQGVGSTWRPNLNGLTQVQMGPPPISFFYGLGSPSITATRIDFVWGIFGAHCVTPSKDNPRVCAEYPDLLSKY